MNRELSNKLYTAYPKIFRQRNLDPRETAMCWGFEVGDGWYAILDDLCRKIQTYCDEKNIQIEAVQVKEKFGGLRFYVNHGDSVISDLTSAAEARSYHTCEECGSPGKIRNSGWLRTLCDQHAAEE